MLVYRFGSCLINVPFDAQRIRDIDFSAEQQGVLVIAYDASLFQPQFSGELEIALKTPQAMKICSTITAMMKRRYVRRSGRTPAR